MSSHLVDSRSSVESGVLSEVVWPYHVNMLEQKPINRASFPHGHYHPGVE